MAEGIKGGRRKRVSFLTSPKPKLPAAAKRKGPVAATSPHPKLNAEHNERAPEHKKPTAKRKRKNAVNAKRAHATVKGKWL